MTTLAVRGPTVVTTTGTTWATTANAVDGVAGVNSATYATLTSTTSGAVATIEIGGFNFAASIASTDTLNSVTISLRHFENNTGRFASVTFRPYDGATALSTGSATATLATAARNDVFNAGTTITLAQLRSSTFKIVVTITGAASTQSRVESIDYVDVTADYTPTPPAITQAAYRWYDDGTESASVALASQDTAASGDVTLQDGIGMLRVRLQSTTAVAVPATDDFQLQWEKTPGTGTLAETYPAVNADSAFTFASTIRIGQTFLGNGQLLARVGFRLSRDATPTGNVTAYLYAHTGTFGSNGTGTGSPLATSTTTVPVSSLTNTTTPDAWYYFDFDGTYTLTNATPYVVTVGHGSSTVYVAVDSSSSTHAGNRASYNGSTWTANANDAIFEVYTKAVTPWANVTSTPVAALADNSAGSTTGSENLSSAANTYAIGQSFTGNGGKLAQAAFWTGRSGSPPGDVYAQLYAHSGTFGTSSVPTGSPLATSTTRVATSLSTTLGFVTFNFDSTLTLANGTKYVLVLTVSTIGDVSNFVVGSTSTTSAHAGNRSRRDSGGTWIPVSSSDHLFQIYETPPPTVIPYASANLTNGAATTNRLGSGSGSFVAGKVSETGIVSDVGWSANNYTELVYSIDIVNTAVVNGDTLRFRVLRNGATTELTYTQTPTINIVKAAVTVTGVSSVSITFDISTVGTVVSGTPALYSDDFNRSNNSDLGSNWSALEGNISITGNVAQHTTGVSKYRWATAVNANQWSEGDMAVTGVNSSLGPAARIIDTSNFYYVWLELTGGPLIQLYSVVTGTYTMLDSVAIASGTTTARIEAEGTTIRVYTGGTLRITVTNSALATGGVGMIGYTESTLPTLDNWRGGDLPYVPLAGGVVTGTAVLAVSIDVVVQGTVIAEIVTGTAVLAITVNTNAIGTVIAEIVTGTAVLALNVNVIAQGTVIAEVVTGQAAVQIGVNIVVQGTVIAEIVTGTAVIPISISSTTVGTRVVTGVSTLNVSVISTTIGTVVGPITGVSAIQIGINVIAQGTVIAEIVTGTSVIQISISSIASGSSFKIVTGTAVIPIIISSTTTGTRVVTGTSALNLSVVTAATGTVVAEIVTGTSVLNVVVQVVAIGTVVGQAPVVTGTSAVAINVVTSVIGTRIVRGTSVIAVNVMSTTTGTRVILGTSAKAITIVTNAIGQRFGVVSGISSVIIAVNITVIGQKVGLIDDVNGMWGDLEFIEMWYGSDQVIDWMMNV